ncbi:MAG: SDR family oxidoreductase [Deltaproteobacteria bacterium]|nr:SDR family oxidoreductase [Deltaproteobacteria bacterium]MBW2359264.1 SDR family oxidoreductase [Deltaproteobacteria bacterium]
MPFQSIYRADLFANRSVIVTGGGSGIGRCIAHELASLGACVAIVGRTEAKLQTVAAEIAEDGGSCRAYPGDIRDEARVKEIVASVLAETGAIDGLVNCAGGQFPALLTEISKKGFNAVLQTNTLGTFQFSREVYQQGMRDGGGSIVNITAVSDRGAPGLGHSAAARAAVENFTKTAAVEWGPAGVRINCVAPGFIASSGADSYESESEKGRLWVQQVKAIVGHVPLKRTGTESEISATVCFLLSDAAAYVSGDTLRVDGALGLSHGWHPLGAGPGSPPFRGFHRAVLPRLLGGSGNGAQ